MSLTYIQFFLVPSSFPSPPPPPAPAKKKGETEARERLRKNRTLIVFRDVTLLQKNV